MRRTRAHPVAEPLGDVRAAAGFLTRLPVGAVNRKPRADSTPISTTAAPVSVCQVTTSPRYSAPAINATTGLRKVTDIARTVPMRRSRR